MYTSLTHKNPTGVPPIVFFAQTMCNGPDHMFQDHN